MVMGPPYFICMQDSVEWNRADCVEYGYGLEPQHPIILRLDESIDLKQHFGRGDICPLVSTFNAIYSRLKGIPYKTLILFYFWSSPYSYSLNILAN